jgi:hypothetical protein
MTWTKELRDKTTTFPYSSWNAQPAPNQRLRIEDWHIQGWGHACYQHAPPEGVRVGYQAFINDRPLTLNAFGSLEAAQKALVESLVASAKAVLEALK